MNDYLGITTQPRYYPWDQYDSHNIYVPSVPFVPSIPLAYQPMLWSALVAGIVDVAILVAVGAWALSLARKAFKGEEVKLP